MGYLKESADAVREAFAATTVDEALEALFRGLWQPTETRDELSVLVGETEERLACDGFPREAGLCRELRASLDAHAGPVEPRWFAVECLRLTGWGKPSPTRAADGFLARREIRAVVVEALAGAVRDVEAARRREDLRKDERREGFAKAGRFALATVLAVGSGGLSLLLPSDPL